MTLLLDGLDAVTVTGAPAEVEISGVEYDSRRVGPGALFCCLPGLVDDGHRYASEAVARGAVALLAERPIEEGPAASVPQALVPPGQARPAMAQVAATFYGHPAEGVLMAGVTGTNGKTTVSHLVAGALSAGGHPCRVIGTLSGTRTTPESPDLQRQLAEVRDEGADEGGRPAVSMEVSSHAVVQSRVDAIRFDAAAFTNLSHEHLDYHGSMEAYFEAKAALFTPERARCAIVNAGDEWGRRLLRRLEIEAVPVELDQAGDVRLEAGRSTFSWRGQRVELALTGLVNVANALLAAESAVALGVEPPEVARGLAEAGPVPGRLEVVGRPHDPATVLVDYAHTPAALDAVLHEARRLAPDGRIVLVVGCGGERDRAKRPQMGEIAARLADRTYVTNDNPRSEDPEAIADEILAGVQPSAEAARRAGRLVVQLDRRRAIEEAVAEARSGDVVLIAGKGHEPYQEVAGARLPFDDREVARQAIGRQGRG